MFRMSDEKVIEVMEHALASDSECSDQELSQFFGKYLPSQKPVLEGLMEILTQRKDGKLEFGLEAREKVFSVLMRKLEMDFEKLAEATNSADMAVELRSFSRMTVRVSDRFRQLAMRNWL